MINEKKKPSRKKIALADAIGNVTYSLMAGGVLDYRAGLDAIGIIGSRTSATALNSITGGPYGWWRELACRVTGTTENSGRIRKGIADLLAFNTFQVPAYAVALGIGSLVSEGQVDFDKVWGGATELATISPLIGPTLGWYMNGIRYLVGIKSAAAGAYRENTPNPPEENSQLNDSRCLKD